MLILSKNLANLWPPEAWLTVLGVFALLVSAFILYLIVHSDNRQLCFKCHKRIGETKWCKDCAEWRFFDARSRGAFESFEGDPE